MLVNGAWMFSRNNRLLDIWIMSIALKGVRVDLLRFQKSCVYE